MLRSWAALLVAFLVAAVVVGCGQQAPALAPTQAPAAKVAEPAKAPAAAQPTTAAAAKAMEYPAKGRPITIIVPWAPGGNADSFTRLAAPTLEKELGVTIEVLNKPGAGGQVGWTEFVRAKPDGHTIAHMTLPNVATVLLDPKREATFSSKDFQVVTAVVEDAGAIAVKSDSPFKTAKDLVDAAKAKPGEIKVSVGGLMGDSHLSGLVFQKATGTKLAIANFADGTAPAVTAMLGGHSDAFAGPLPNLASMGKSGDVRVLGVLTAQESKFLPGVKTVEAQGYPGALMSSHTAFSVPAGTPKEIVDKLSAVFKKVMDSPELSKKLEDAWQNKIYMNSEEATALWQKVQADTKVLVEGLGQ